MIELYNPKFVRFEWDKELEGKKGFVALSIKALKEQVNNCLDTMATITDSRDDVCPFTYFLCDGCISSSHYNFAYYDPDYAAKKAFMEGQTVDAMRNDNDMLYDWFPVSKDTAAEGFNFNEFKVRLKPVAMRYHVIIVCDTFIVESEETCTSKHKYYTGLSENCDRWIEEHKHLRSVMMAWEQGKTIQFKNNQHVVPEWIDIANPIWEATTEYRVKPEEDICEVGIEGKCPKFVIHNVTKTGHHIPTYSFFKGNYDECEKWCDEHRKFIGTMAAWEEGEPVQCFDNAINEWADTDTPAWHTDCQYRINPDYTECKGCLGADKCMSVSGKRCMNYRVYADKYEPFDNLQELITKWEGMNPGCTNRPKCAMPMIWVKSEFNGCIHLITGYDQDDSRPVRIDDEWYSLKDLFSQYRFINDSIIGKRSK